MTILGKDIRWDVSAQELTGYVQVPWRESADLEETWGEIDRTNQASGGWTESGRGLRSATTSFTIEVNRTAGSAFLIFETASNGNGEVYLRRIEPNGSTSITTRGKFIVNGITFSTPIGEDYTATMPLKNSGAFVNV